MENEKEKLLTPLQKAYLAANPDATLIESEPEQVQTSSRKDKWRARKGIGGLLALAVIGTFLGPILSLGRNYGNLRAMEYTNPSLLDSQGWVVTKATVWAFFWVSTAISVYAGKLLLKDWQPSTVRAVIGCIWVGGPLVTAVSMFVLPTIGPELPQLAASVILAALWTTYFLTSQRVKNTYRFGGKI